MQKHVGLASLDHAGGLELREVFGDHRRQQRTELVERGRCAGLVDVDELVGLEPEHLAEVGAGAPVAEQVADAGERVAAVAESGDQLEAPEVAGPVQTDATLPARSGEDPDGLVLPEGAHRKAHQSGQLVDGPLPRSDLVRQEAMFVSGSTMGRQ